MPTSSTVWWPSMCRSPSASMSRSIRPWRAIWSSMWSKKPMPVDSLACPVPSRLTRTVICVSAVLRETSAVRGAVDGHKEAFSAASICAFSSAVPTVRRRQLASSGCILETFLTSTLRSLHARRRSLAASGTRTRIMLASLGKACTPGSCASASSSRRALRAQIARLRARTRRHARARTARFAVQHADVVGRAHLVDLGDQRLAGPSCSRAAHRPGRTCSGCASAARGRCRAMRSM